MKEVGGYFELDPSGVIRRCQRVSCSIRRSIGGRDA